MLTFLFAVYRESNLQFLLGREVLYHFRQIIWIVPYLSSSDNGRRLLSAYLPRVLQRFATISSSSLPKRQADHNKRAWRTFLGCTDAMSALYFICAQPHGQPLVGSGGAALS